MKVILVLILISCFFGIAAKAQEMADVINFVAPEKYPAAARAVRASGEVVVEVQIDSNGQVTSATVVKGHPLLRAVSEQAALKWQFSKAFAQSKTAIQLTFDYQVGERKAIESSEKETEMAFRSNHPSPFRVEVIAETLIPKLLLLPREDGEIKTAICEIHKQIMQLEIQEIVYGSPYSNETENSDDDDESDDNEKDFWEIEEEFFPHANISSLGGYNDDEIKIKRKEVHFCHICRLKLQEWSQKNR